MLESDGLVLDKDQGIGIDVDVEGRESLASTAVLHRPASALMPVFTGQSREGAGSQSTDYSTLTGPEIT